MKKSILIICAVFSAFCFAGFNNSCKDEKKLPECFFTKWEYEGVNGPEYWKGLCEDYMVCGGMAQSPINIVGAIDDTTLSDITLIYAFSATQIAYQNNGILFSYDLGNSIIVDGESYRFSDLHMHTHSEHALNGANYPMEIHFVHNNYSTGRVVIIGVFVKEGAENAIIEPFIDHLPVGEGFHYFSEIDTFNAADIYPVDKSYFTYGGSSGIPPCSENVTWIIMEKPIEASAAQIQAFETIQGKNIRPLQLLGGRTIRYHKS